MTQTIASLIPSGDWRIDSASSVVGFHVRHLGLLHLRGRFESFAGTVACDSNGSASIEGAVRVASIETGEPKRDARLRTADFFDVDRHPTISFEGRVPPCANGGSFEACGALSIKGVSRPQVLAIQPMPVGEGRVQLRAEGTLRRSDFGLDWDPAFAAGGLVIDDRVRLGLEVLVLCH